MDITTIAAKLGLQQSKPLIRKAQELRRLSDVHFDSSVTRIGEISKAIICLELAASRLQVLFDRRSAIRMSGMSEKAYMRSFNAMQNGLGVRARLDVRELAIQFGCVRLIPFVQRGLALYKDRFVVALPASRRASADFNRPVFTAAAFYLCAKRHKLKVDKLKLIELCGTSESEFAAVSNSMSDLCFDVFGISKEKKEPKVVKGKLVKGQRESSDALPSERSPMDESDAFDSSADDQDGLEVALPSKRNREDEADAFDFSADDQDGLELPRYKRRKLMENLEYEECKSSVGSSSKQQAVGVSAMPKKQAGLSLTRTPKTIALEAS